MRSATSFLPLLLAHLRMGHLRAAGMQIMVVAVVLLLAGMMMLGANVTRLRDGYGQVRHSVAVLTQLAAIDEETIGIEFSVRGLALTESGEYAHFFNNRRDHLRGALRQLKELLSDDGAKTQQAAALAGLLEKRVALLEDLIRSQNHDPRTVGRIIVQPEVRNIRYHALAIVAALRKSELNKLDDLQMMSQRKASETYHQAVFIVVMAFLLALLGIALCQSGQHVHDI
jgi:CHASE3 domain sensor protein